MGGQLRKTIDRLGSTGRIVMVLIALATVGAVAYLVKSAGPASYVAAYTNLDPKAAGEIQAALAGEKIPAKIEDGGRTVMVPGSQIEAVRVALAKSKVAIGGHEGWSLLDNQKLSTTEQQQQVNLQRAMAGNLATAIEEIQGVHRATVNLAIPKDTVFTQDQRQPTASVLLDTAGGQLSEETVRGVVRLVASGVPGLTAQNVAITNERGELLSSTENGIGELAAGRLSAEASWNRRKTAHVQAVLDAMLGPGRSTVVVTGLLDFNSRSTKRQEFGKKAGALTSDIENEKLTTEGGAAGGPAGTPANVPGAAAAGQAGRSDYDHKKDQSQNAIDTTVTEETAAGGEPKKISVALAISKDGLQNVGGNEEDARSAIEEQVKAAVGFEEERDVIATTVNRQFADTAEALKKAGVTGASAAAGDPITRMLGPFGVYLKPGLALAGLAAMLFLVRRSLRRRQALLASTDASWLPALEAPPIKIEELMPTLAAPSEAQLAGHQKKQLQERIEELATNRPSEVATQLRGWLATDG